MGKGKGLTHFGSRGAVLLESVNQNFEAHIYRGASRSIGLSSSIVAYHTNFIDAEGTHLGLRDLDLICRYISRNLLNFGQLFGLLYIHPI